MSRMTRPTRFRLELLKLRTEQGAYCLARVFFSDTDQRFGGMLTLVPQQA